MKVSVLIPAYNAEKYISECLNSICNQTHSDLQIVVFDDGSSDMTLDIIRKHASQDSRIEVYTRENRGVAVTRNQLIGHAVGEYTLFVDADDWIESDMVESLFSMSRKYGADISMCTFMTGRGIDLNKIDSTEKKWDKDEFLHKFLLHRELTGSLCNKLIRTELYKKSRFIQGIGYGEDAMVMWDILNNSSLMAVTERQLYHYRMNDDSVSHQGFSESKMSVIPVWEYICSHIDSSRQDLSLLARARYGAEVTLLLLEGVKCNVSSREPNVKLLREKLAALYPFMKRSKTLSRRFMLFAFMARVNWPVTSYIVR